MSVTGAEPPAPALFSREEFLTNRWVYSTGEHVSIIGPTNAGKTTLGFQLLQRSASIRRPALVMVMKPRDATVTRWGKSLQFGRVRDWPPLPPLLRARPRGWLVWPRHVFDPVRDNVRLHNVFRKAILESYRRGDRILFCDEAAGLADELRLSTELTTVLSRGRSMGCGVWCATQRPTQIPLLAYSGAHHLFLAHNPDARDRQRFREIGGIDSKLIEQIVLNLRPHQWLYIRRDGPRYCILDK